MLSLFCNYQASLSQTKFEVKLRVEAHENKVDEVDDGRPSIFVFCDSFLFLYLFLMIFLWIPIYIPINSVKTVKLIYYLIDLIFSQYFHYLKNKEKTSNYCRNLRWKYLLSLNLLVFRNISCNFWTLSRPKF